MQWILVFVLIVRFFGNLSTFVELAELREEVNQKRVFNRFGFHQKYLSVDFR